MIKLYICCLVLIIGSVEVGLDIDMKFHQEVMEIVSYDTTLEEVDMDLLKHGVTLPGPIKFRPLSLFCRKPAGLQLGIHVGRKSGLKPVKLS